MSGDLSAAWEREAEHWARFVRTPGHDHFRERFNWPRFLELVPRDAGPTLDLGCGEGRAGPQLRAHGCAPVVGIDASPTLADLAHQGGGYDAVHLADATALPLGDDAFALVVAFMSLHDMDDLDGVLREVARVLRPGGQLVAAVVHPIASAKLGELGERPYFETHRYAEPLDRGGIPMTFHSMHRSLEAFLAGFTRAGLLLADVREPVPDDAHVADEPSVARSQRRPLFLHVRATAP